MKTTINLEQNRLAHCPHCPMRLALARFWQLPRLQACAKIRAHSGQVPSLHFPGCRARQEFLSHFWEADFCLKQGRIQVIFRQGKMIEPPLGNGALA